MLGLVAAGALLRLLMLARGSWLLDSDEAVVAVMANHVLHGERPIFFYGQPYLGALQAYLAAPLYALFGMSRVTAKLVTVPEYLAFTASIYFLARRVYDRQAALLAVALVALPPIYVLATTTRVWGAHVDALSAGNLILLLAIDDAYGGQPAHSRRRFAAMGLLAGFGFWLHPHIVIYILTAAILILLNDHRAAIRPAVLVAIPAAVIGALPVLEAARSHGAATLQYLLHGNQHYPSHRYLAVAHYFAAVVLPELIGMRAPWAGGLLLLRIATALVTLAAFAGLLISRRRAAVGWLRLSLCRGEPRDALILFCLIASAAFIFSTFGRAGLEYYQHYRFDATGRYAMPLLTALPIVVAGEIARAWRRSHALAVGALLILAASTLTGYLQSSPSDPWQSPYWRAQPASNQGLIEALDQLGVPDAWMTVWVGRSVTVDTRERISTADYASVIAGRSPDRLAAQTQRVLADPLPAFVFVRPNGHAELEDWLEAHQIPYQKRVAAPYVVLRPLQHLDPAQVAAYLGS